MSEVFLFVWIGKAYDAGSGQMVSAVQGQKNMPSATDDRFIKFSFVRDEHVSVRKCTLHAFFQQDEIVQILHPGRTQKKIVHASSLRNTRACEDSARERAW